MSRLLLALVVLAAFAGCGGGGDPNAVLSQTAAKLGAVRGAKSMHLKFLVEPRNGEAFGFELEGPVALCTGGKRLPVLDVDYRQMANGREATVRLISDGNQGYVDVGGTAYELNATQEKDLRSSCGALGGGNGLERLRVDDWVHDASASTSDGVDEVEGDLDVVAVTNDLVDIARAFGNSRLSRLDADDAKRIAEATEDSHFELESGHDDHLLRRLALDVDLGLDVPEDLRAALGDAVGATITFELDLDGPNEPVTVKAPANARPSSELPTS